MRQNLRNFLSQKIAVLINTMAESDGMTDYKQKNVRIDYPPEYKLGHYATPIAMELAKTFRQSPKVIAEKLRDILLNDEQIKTFCSTIEIAGAGFINITFKPTALTAIIKKGFSLKQWVNEQFLNQQPKPKVIFEFVSANPTGPLNIVSARAAAVGDSLCRVLRQAGVPTHSEYYVNDFGNQVRLLGISFAYRYAESMGLPLDLPEDAYQGEYIRQILDEILQEKTLPNEIAKPNADDVKAWAEKAGDFFGPLAIAKLVASQQGDLKGFRCDFDLFFHESTLHPQAVSNAFEKLKSVGVLYEEQGAWFLASTRFGDDKDRVVVRVDGRPTYLMADIAYHLNKTERGFQQIINIWGPDHHGYIARLKAALQAVEWISEEKENSFEVLIVQQVNLIEDGKAVVMSKRLGKFHTMRDLTERIPVDVCRYFFVTRGVSTHLNFDLELATTQSSRNPVYYVQYAHARIHSIFRQAGLDFKSFAADLTGKENFLQGFYRDELLYQVLRLPEEIEDIARNYEIQALPEWLYKAATLFSKFYSQSENNVLKTLELNKDEGLTLLTIAKVTGEALAHALHLIGIEAPTEMNRDEEAEV